MSKTTNVMTIIYELLDEIIGGILPGVYFCTYFLMCALVIVGDSLFNSNTNNVYLIGIPFLSISYVLGTLFKRGSNELTDIKSVKYILKKSKCDIRNSEFMLNLPDDYIKEILISKLREIKDEYHIHISLYYIENQKRIWQTVKKPQHKIVFYVLKSIKRKYFVSNLICMIINPLNNWSNKEIKLIKKAISKRDVLKKFYEDLNSKIDFKVDYPYTHLKQYLKNNGMPELAEKVTWNSPEGRKTKAFINNILSILTENNYPGMKQVKKREAHIRFMNSVFHSQRMLFVCTSVVFAGIFLLYIIRFLWLWYLGFPNDPITFGNSGKVVFVFYKLFDYIGRVVAFETLFTIMGISAVYTVFYLVTRRLVLGNYHYQRIHEIVYLLQAQEHIEKKREAIKNEY